MPRILVIDDEQLLRSTVVMILPRAGFTVVEASDGQAGIAMFHKNPPDISPYRHLHAEPGWDRDHQGVEAFEPSDQDYCHDWRGKLRVMEIASAAHVLGADYVLDKPFDSESLLTAITAVLVTPLPTRS